MLHTNNPIIKHKTGLLNLAEELVNVSKACKIMGVSRDTFYRYQELAEKGGIDALINRSRRVPNLKNRTDETTEQAVVEYVIEEVQILAISPTLVTTRKSENWDSSFDLPGVSEEFMSNCDQAQAQSADAQTQSIRHCSFHKPK